MTTIYDRFRALGASLLSPEKFGVPATLIRVVGTYNPATDSRSKTETSVPCFATVNDQIITTDSGVTITRTVGRLTVEAKKGDRLIFGTREFTVCSVIEKNPDGQGAILWEAVLET